MLSAGGVVRDQTGAEDRFAVITYVVNIRKFVFSARRRKTRSSSYICQLRQGLYLYKLTSNIAI